MMRKHQGLKHGLQPSFFSVHKETGFKRESSLCAACVTLWINVTLPKFPNKYI